MHCEQYGLVKGRCDFVIDLRGFLRKVPLSVARQQTRDGVGRGSSLKWSHIFGPGVKVNSRAFEEVWNGDETETVHGRVQEASGAGCAPGDQTIQGVAAKHKVHPSQVSTWKRQAVEGLKGVFSSGRSKHEKNHEAMIRVELTRFRGHIQSRGVRRDPRWQESRDGIRRSSGGRS